MGDYVWVDTRNPWDFPGNAVRGGTDANGDEIYVGKALHQGDWLPAKVIPNKNCAYVSYSGREIRLQRFQVMCKNKEKFTWVPCKGNNIPSNAVEGGETADGEPLYVGRVIHRSSQTVGKVHPSHSVCYIPFGGRELNFGNYEILVKRN